MYAYFKGIIAEKGVDHCVLEVNGIGYNIKLSVSTASSLPVTGSTIKLYTYTSVKEDDISLFGFVNKDDLDIFKLLINVNGIGPKGAQSILSVMSADDLRFAIVSGDAKMIAKAPGIGTKTAQRVLLDLHDKVSLEDVLTHGVESSTSATGTASILSKSAAEAVEALTALGYSSADAAKAVASIGASDDMDVETILKASLKYLY